MLHDKDGDGKLNKTEMANMIARGKKAKAEKDQQSGKQRSAKKPPQGAKPWKYLISLKTNVFYVTWDMTWQPASHLVKHIFMHQSNRLVGRRKIMWYTVRVRISGPWLRRNPRHPSPFLPSAKPRRSMDHKPPSPGKIESLEAYRGQRSMVT